MDRVRIEESMSFYQSSVPAVNNPWITFLQYSLFVILLFGMKLWLISSYGNATPWLDQWDADAAKLYKPFLEGTLRWTDLFVPHNEHRVFTQRLLALAELRINGIWSPLFQMVIDAGLHIAVILFAIALLTRVVGGGYLPALLIFALILFGIPYAWENTLEGDLGSAYYFAVLFSMALLWLTVTENPFSARWWGGVACGMLAFLSLASGVLAFAAAVLMGFTFYVLGLRKTKLQLAAIAILAGLFIVGAALTPTIAGHAYLKARSFSQFLDALKAILAWPLSSSFLFAILRNLPSLVFVGLLLWKRPPAHDRRWFLMALVVWALGQAAIIAYGRAAGSLSSRYLDTFAIAILVNFACLISIVQDHLNRQRGWANIGMAVWAVWVLFPLNKGLNQYLIHKRSASFAEEVNTRNYILTGNLGHLTDKPPLHIPYPDPKRLALILESSTIRDILPVNIRIPLELLSSKSEPNDAFALDGFYPTTVKYPGVNYGSYNSWGNSATGTLKMEFASEGKTGFVAIPIAGYPLSEGMRIEVEQNGRRIALPISENPKEVWSMAFAKLDSGPFAIHVTDASPSYWVAVGLPRSAGRWDGLTERLLANFRSSQQCMMDSMSESLLSLARRSSRSCIFQDVPGEGYIEMPPVSCDGSIDMVNGISPAPQQTQASGVLSVGGWLAVSAKKGIVPDDIFVTLKTPGGAIRYIKTRRGSRPDVNRAFQQPALGDTGYSTTVDISALNGEYLLGLARAYKGKLERCSQFNLPVKIGGV